MLTPTKDNSSTGTGKPTMTPSTDAGAKARSKKIKSIEENQFLRELSRELDLKMHSQSQRVVFAFRNKFKYTRRTRCPSTSTRRTGPSSRRRR